MLHAPNVLDDQRHHIHAQIAVWTMAVALLLPHMTLKCIKHAKAVYGGLCARRKAMLIAAHPCYMKGVKLIVAHVCQSTQHRKLPARDWYAQAGWLPAAVPHAERQVPPACLWSTCPGSCCHATINPKCNIDISRAWRNEGTQANDHRHIGSRSACCQKIQDDLRGKPLGLTSFGMGLNPSDFVVCPWALAYTYAPQPMAARAQCRGTKQLGSLHLMH